ncbi:pyrimidine-nucleoside phosphorylase [Sporolactobacillus sp. CPB3-1]|uniref:Pyrimidine-nucleoside phosphorylase n=1 Tax=Sporolactobacillus mangiferae TaxID=2940498 RepID=A0ABT0MAV8_9BACL|nr:pyrimidine-nucleoside phosphorylase [Sporolactobacillus mangiferae]MCL1631414.1 pyrimidine-nucleoside phosphorylase [Sporolactobacillus mangiferae]
MRMVDIITKKRDGIALTDEEIRFFIEGYTHGTIPDYQASALAMAIYFRDMNDSEIAALTRAMVDSGDTVDLSPIAGLKVDKHSTGGVGDTTTLVLAPLVASVNVPVAKMSGRGLGFTGGTLDKLESISGFSVEMDGLQFIDHVNRDQIAVIGQSGDLVPADKKLYALRDVSGSIESIPLIASSVMSKKIAAGADAIVLEVTCGSGAFMKSERDAIRLAETMVRIGIRVGRKTAAVITDMSQPLGFAIGNALEVKEAIDTLRGHGPEDLKELVLELGSRMVVFAERAKTRQEARLLLEQALDQGRAFDKFRQFIENQGGDPSVADHPERLPQAKYQIELPARSSGVIAEMKADQIGLAAMLLGAGRATKEEQINHATGIVLHKKVGDSVAKDEPLLTIHSDSKDVAHVVRLLNTAIRLADQASRPALIHKIIE